MNELDVVFGALREGAPWYAAATGATVLAVRAYRAPAIQRSLPSSLHWVRQPRIVRQLVVAVTAGLTSWLAALAAGHDPRAAALAALPVAFASIGAHKLTKAAGHAHTRAALSREGPDYDPGVARRAIDPLLPIDHKRLDIVKRLHQSQRRRGGDHV